MEVIYHNNGGEEEEKKKKKKNKKRRSRAMHVIKVILFMLRRKRRKSLDTGFWRRLMETIHPAKPYEITKMPPPASLLPPPAAVVAKDGHSIDLVEELSEVEEVFTAVASSSSMTSSSTRSVSRSQYGSVQSLNEMDMYGDEEIIEEDDEVDDDGYGGDDDRGDEMIDVKAEEFIMRFYAQMKMQNQAYMDRCNAKRNQKNHA